MMRKNAMGIYLHTLFSTRRNILQVNCLLCSLFLNMYLERVITSETMKKLHPFFHLRLQDDKYPSSEKYAGFNLDVTNEQLFQTILETLLADPWIQQEKCRNYKHLLAYLNRYNYYREFEHMSHFKTVYQIFAANGAPVINENTIYFIDKRRPVPVFSKLALESEDDELFCIWDSEEVISNVDRLIYNKSKKIYLMSPDMHTYFVFNPEDETLVTVYGEEVVTEDGVEDEFICKKYTEPKSALSVGFFHVGTNGELVFDKRVPLEEGRYIRDKDVEFVRCKEENFEESLKESQLGEVYFDMKERSLVIDAIGEMKFNDIQKIEEYFGAKIGTAILFFTDRKVVNE